LLSTLGRAVHATVLPNPGEFVVFVGESTATRCRDGAQEKRRMKETDAVALPVLLWLFHFAADGLPVPNAVSLLIGFLKKVGCFVVFCIWLVKFV
jgi:hypothetical protein